MYPSASSDASRWCGVLTGFVTFDIKLVITSGHSWRGSSMHAMRDTHCAAVDGRDFSVPSEANTCSIRDGARAQPHTYVCFDDNTYIGRHGQPANGPVLLHLCILGDERILQLQSSRLSNEVIELRRTQQFGQLTCEFSLQSS
jgi:hypothetical protein